MTLPYRYEHPSGFLGAVEASQTPQGPSVSVTSGSVTVYALVAPEDAQEVADGLAAVLLAGTDGETGAAS